jgi:hypothetical protein
MSIKEQVLNVDQPDSPVSLSHGVEKTTREAHFIFDPALSTAIAANGNHEAKATVPKGPLSSEMLGRMNRYWRAATLLFQTALHLIVTTTERLINGFGTGSQTTLQSSECETDRTFAAAMCRSISDLPQAFSETGCVAKSSLLFKHRLIS